MPMNTAIGMVIAMEKTPQGLSASALMMTTPRTAMRMTMMRMMPMEAMIPPVRPSSSRVICPSERPLRRMEKNRTI